MHRYEHRQEVTRALLGRQKPDVNDKEPCLSDINDCVDRQEETRVLLHKISDVQNGPETYLSDA